jgi:hypothetical protein
MKTAIYIEDGTVQLVITPETEFEKNALSSFEARPLEAKIFSGSFYDCRGGWVRQQVFIPNQEHYLGVIDDSDRSLILRVGVPAFAT